MQAKKVAHDAEMKNILTPEQYQKWEKQREERMKERREINKDKSRNNNSKNTSYRFGN